MISNFSQLSNWNKSLLKQESTIKEAILNLNNSMLQIILVINKKKELIGTITDGDIRRGFLKGSNLSSPIKNIINFSPLIIKVRNQKYVYPQNLNIVNHLPVIDQKKKIIGLLSKSIKNDKKILKNNFVIMAGGEGKRLMPLTKYIPKPMLEIDNKPILEHIINHAKSFGIVNFYISVNYLKNIIKKYFKSGKQLKVNIQYLEEKTASGTAGSLRLIKAKSKDPLIVSNGDIICNIDYEELLKFHNQNKAFATIVVKPTSNKVEYGIAYNKNLQLKNIHEKPIFTHDIVTGIYVFNMNIYKYLKKNKVDMPHLFELLLKLKKKILVYPIYESWEDVSNKFKL